MKEGANVGVKGNALGLEKVAESVESSAKTIKFEPDILCQANQATQS